MKVVLVGIVLLFFTSCGVWTNSSHSSKSIAVADVNGTVDVEIDSNDTNGTNEDGSVTVNVEGGASNAGFSRVDAVFDAQACIANALFHHLEDSSFDPTAAADATNGVEIDSQYSYSVDLEAAKVVLYYPSLTTSLVNEKVHIYEDNYRLGFDKAWYSNPLQDVYVRTPKDKEGFYSCYRYDLGSLSGTTIKKTKVYR